MLKQAPMPRAKFRRNRAIAHKSARHVSAQGNSTYVEMFFSVRICAAMKTIFSILENRDPRLIAKLSFLMILILSVVQIAAGGSINFAPVFVFPILFNSWYGSKKTGLLMAVFSILALIFIEVFISPTRQVTYHLFIYTLPYLFTYPILAILITDFRNVYRVEAKAADTDILTGLHSLRSFYAEVANELHRSERYDHVFTLAYIDIDDFKNINDSYGHAEGDDLLTEVADCLVSSLRSTDIVARLGGDEYACLLPETTQEEARHAFDKTVKVLKNRMRRHKWPVSFSIGVVTFVTLPADVSEAIDAADRLMYSVKNQHKDNIAYHTYQNSDE